jgi:hypothetical protein
LLTPCFDDAGNHGAPEEGCFCGVETPHLHAHVHDPKTCNEDSLNTVEADLMKLARMTLHPTEESVNSSLFQIPISERLPKECNSKDFGDSLHAPLQKRRMHKVKVSYIWIFNFAAGFLQQVILIFLFFHSTMITRITWFTTRPLESFIWSIPVQIVETAIIMANSVSLERENGKDLAVFSSISLRLPNENLVLCISLNPNHRVWRHSDRKLSKCQRERLSSKKSLHVVRQELVQPRLSNQSKWRWKSHLVVQVAHAAKNLRRLKSPHVATMAHAANLRRLKSPHAATMVHAANRPWRLLP